MKVKVLTRNPTNYVRDTIRDIAKVPRSANPDLHPFQADREYVRALQATKLERLFAKPFVGSLDGHKDGVQVLRRFHHKLTYLVSGSFDGELRVWNVPDRTCLVNVQAHVGHVHGVATVHQDLFESDTLVTVGADKLVKVWTLPTLGQGPRTTLASKHVLTDVDHSWTDKIWATGGEVVQIWDYNKSIPLREYKWGVDTVQRLRFNPVETNLIAATAQDRSITLYDIRDSQPLRKVIMKLRSNAVSWNPMEAFTFTVANEDYNLYTWDMRRLKEPANIHMDHTSAVMDVDYSPTGREFVSGSYDKTIRIFSVRSGHSREVYHTKRMQRVLAVLYSADSRFIMSGSDEMNIRVWKSSASEKLGPIRPRESAALRYAGALKRTFAAHPEVKRIARHRHVPKHVLHAKKEHRVIHESQKRKESNRRRHSKPGLVPHVPERRKHAVEEVE